MAWRMVVPGAHLARRVLAALGVCGACCTRRMCWLCVLALCKVGCLGRTRCKRGVALVKFQTFPISYVVTGRIYWPATKLTAEFKISTFIFSLTILVNRFFGSFCKSCTTSPLHILIAVICLEVVHAPYSSLINPLQINLNLRQTFLYIALLKYHIQPVAEIQMPYMKHWESI